MEQYYRICMDPLPTFRFGFMHTSKSYRWSCPAREQPILELNYVITGSIHLEQGDRQETVCRGQLFFLTHDQPVDAFSEDSLYQEYTCGLKLARPATLADTEEIATMRYNSSEAIIPLRITEPSICRKAYNLLTAIGAHRRDSSDPMRMVMVKARLYELLALLSRYSLQQARRQYYLSGAQQNPHCRKACQYIQAHLSEKIRAETVAAAAGIGSRQLSALFRKHLGTTLVNYVNTEKIQRVKQLILTEGTSLETAGAAVGIENTKYLSTLFHKYTGMTVQECKKMRPQVRRSGGF